VTEVTCYGQVYGTLAALRWLPEHRAAVAAGVAVAAARGSWLAAALRG
jgi:hypothetical protein